MELSNTAIPRYYGEFRDRVLRGEIVVNREMSLEMNRIDELIANPQIYYSPKIVEGFVKFCENEMTLRDGSKVEMLDSFKLWGEQLFGWYYFVPKSVFIPGKNGQPGHYVQKQIKKRLINKQFIITGRGAAKSLYETFVNAYYLTVDKSTSDQVTTAPTMHQAEEVMTPFRTAIVRARGPYFKFLTMGSIQNTTGNKLNRPQLATTKEGITNYLTNSTLKIVPMSVDKTQGLNIKVATVDEWLSGETREDVIGSLEQGLSKVSNYILLAVSSEGTIRNGPGDTIKMELSDILNKKYINRHVSIFWYKLDDVSEVGDPNMWIKANPNLGKTVSYDIYQQEVQKAEHVPSARNDILAKRFGIPTEGYTYYFTYDETLPQGKMEFWKMPCSLGCDLSQGNDFCAFTFLFPLPNGGFGVKVRAYITYLTFSKLRGSARQKYQEFLDEGSLVVLEGVTLELDDVYDDLDKHIESQEYDVRSFGYDPWNARHFVDRWMQENGPYGVEKVIQGAKTESVPLSEIKTLAQEKMLRFDESLLSFCMQNAVALVDSNNNKKLAKNRYAEKIDTVSALIDAYVAYKVNKDLFD